MSGYCFLQQRDWDSQRTPVSGPTPTIFVNTVPISGSREQRCACIVTRLLTCVRHLLNPFTGRCHQLTQLTWDVLNSLTASLSASCLLAGRHTALYSCVQPDYMGNHFIFSMERSFINCLNCCLLLILINSTKTTCTKCWV